MISIFSPIYCFPVDKKTSVKKIIRPRKYPRGKINLTGRADI